MVTIDNHLNNKRGCPGCSGSIPWTFERFVEKANIIHDHKYNYENTDLLMVKGKRHKINTTCNLCGHIWMVTIDNHVYNKTGCPNCGGNLQWTEEKFLQRAKEIHGPKYTYYPKAPGIAMNSSTQFQLLCNTCNYI